MSLWLLAIGLVYAEKAAIAVLGVHPIVEAYISSFAVCKGS